MSFDYKQWWAENRDEYNAKRRKRYASDPEYRRNVKKWSKAAQERAAQERRRKDAVRKVDETTGFREVEEDGETYYTIGMLARLAGSSVHTVRKWEQQGDIPEPQTRGAQGDRLYSEAELLDILIHLEELGRVKEASTATALHNSALIRTADGDEVETKVFSIGFLADAMGRSNSSVKRMVRDERFPPTPLRTPSRNQRRYTYEQIQSALEAWESRGREIRGREAWQSFYDEVANAWAELGLTEEAKILKLSPEPS